MLGKSLAVREVDAGRRYWTSIWGSSDSVVISEARRWLAGQTTPYRALWVATTTTPVNAADILDILETRDFGGDQDQHIFFYDGG